MPASVSTRTRTRLRRPAWRLRRLRDRPRCASSGSGQHLEEGFLGLVSGHWQSSSLLCCRVAVSSVVPRPGRVVRPTPGSACRTCPAVGYRASRGANSESTVCARRWACCASAAVVTGCADRSPSPAPRSPGAAADGDDLELVKTAIEGERALLDLAHQASGIRAWCAPSAASGDRIGRASTSPRFRLPRPTSTSETGDSSRSRRRRSVGRPRGRPGRRPAASATLGRLPAPQRQGRWRAARLDRRQPCRDG